MNISITEFIESILIAATLSHIIQDIEDLQSQKLDDADKRHRIAGEIKDSKKAFNGKLTVLKGIIEDIEFFEL